MYNKIEIWYNIGTRFLIINFDGSKQFGWIAGHYPSWDERHPLHFVGHSAGVQVVRVLQQMLADKVLYFLSRCIFVSLAFFLTRIVNLLAFVVLQQAFSGYDTSEDWVLSLTSLSGALNGTTRAYFDGMR